MADERPQPAVQGRVARTWPTTLTLTDNSAICVAPGSRDPIDIRASRPSIFATVGRTGRRSRMPGQRYLRGALDAPCSRLASARYSRTPSPRWAGTAGWLAHPALGRVTMPRRLRRSWGPARRATRRRNPRACLHLARDRAGLRRLSADIPAIASPACGICRWPATRATH